MRSRILAFTPHSHTRGLAFAPGRPRARTLQNETRKAREKRQKEAARAEALGKAPVKRVPNTLENTREDDITFVRADDEDVAAEEEQDEFAAHFRSERPPHVLLTTCYTCTGVMYKFCADLMVRAAHHCECTRACAAHAGARDK